MPVNIEIKARVRDRESLEARARAAADGPAKVLEQRDTFFHFPKGRLKLREEGLRAELIFYERDDDRSPKPSNYHVLAVDDPASLIDLLEQALGIRGQVVKERTLYLAGQTRIHLDRVEDLGDFMELEVVLDEKESLEHGRRIAHALMQELGIVEQDLESKAYIDLLQPSA